MTWKDIHAPRHQIAIRREEGKLEGKDVSGGVVGDRGGEINQDRPAVKRDTSTTII